jgi:hypothetical protein
MGFAGLIGPAISGISGLAGKAGGGKGGGTASVSPQQAALAEYTRGQQILANNSKFASSGTGLSTMKTFANAGAGIGAEEQLAGVADTNLQAQNAVQQSNLQQLASSAGFGTQGGSFGNTGGNTGGNVNTNPGT